MNEENKTSLETLEYLVRFPSEQHQYHNVGEAAGISESLDYRLEEYLKEQIRKGCRSVKELASRADLFVGENLLKVSDAPDFYRH